jgi:hypothetical protein
MIDHGAEQICDWLLTVLACCAAVAQAVQPVKVQGSQFVNSISGKRFYVIGVAYVDLI